MPTKRENTQPTSDRAGERARDEQREEGGPRYGGGTWEVADERGDSRYGNARNDDANPSELDRGEANIDDDDEWRGASTQSSTVTDVEDDGRSESGGQQVGMGRGDRPPTSKSHTRPHPRSKR